MLLAGTTGLNGCGTIDRAVNLYLDGCRDKQLFLERESLRRVDADPLTLGPIQFRAPQGSYARTDRNQVSVFQDVYCDSGDWGVDVGNQIRVKLYDGPAPASLYEDPPQEQVRPLETMAPADGKLDHDIVLGRCTWSARIELWGGLVPRVRTAYLTTALDRQTLTVSFVAAVGEAADPSPLVAVVESLCEVKDGN